MKYFFVFWWLLLLISCSVTYLPVSSDGVAIQDQFGIVKNDDLIFIAQYKSWNVEPQNISDYFTSFHITIQNRTHKMIEVESDNLAMIDENGNQFDPLPIDYIEKLLLPDEMRFESFAELTEKQPQIIENWREARQNIMRDSFHFGRILPNAKRSGYVFFTKLSATNKNCKIIFQDKTIMFERTDKKKN
jgi:hypothetical protein